MAHSLDLTGVPLADLSTLLRAARVQAAALRNEPDSHTRAFVRVLHDELTDQINGLQDAQCDDADERPDAFEVAIDRAEYRWDAVA